QRLLRSSNVAAPNHRYRNGLFDCGYDIPVCQSTVTLLTSAPVNRDHVPAAVFNQARYFNRMERRIIPSGPYLHRHRDRDGFADSAQDLFKLEQITKQRRAPSAV